MSEILCDCCNTEGDHPSRIICDACFQSAKGKADCCIATQAENKRLKKVLGFLKTTLLHSKTLSEKEFVALKDIIEQALKEK